MIADSVSPLLSISHGRKVKPANWHITLAFLGNVPVANRACFNRIAGRMQCPPFQLHLNRLGHWPRPKVVWLAPAESPSELMQLQQNLSQGLQACGYQPEARPYQPHLTLLRKGVRAPNVSEIEPICMDVVDFVLARSDSMPDGVEYQIVQRWPLTE